MPKHIQCSRCGVRPRIGGKEKLGKMNNLCVECAIALSEMGDCPCCGNPVTDHADKCVTRQQEIDVTTSNVEEAVAESV